MTIEFAFEQLLKKTMMQKGFRNRKWAFNIFFSNNTMLNGIFDGIFNEFYFVFQSGTFSS